MNTKLLLCLFIIAGFCSCSTAYRSGQTPDDVYYSPAPPQNDYVKQNNDQDKNVYTSSTEDIEIRSRIHNRRWRRYDNYGFDYYYYDYRYPFYVEPNYKYGKLPNKYNEPRKFNLGGYKPADDANNTKLNDVKSGKSNSSGNAPIRTFNSGNSNTNNGGGVGNFIRKVFSGNNNSNSSNDNTNPTRTFDNSRNTNNNSSNNNSNSNSGSSNSGSSGSGSNAPVRSFPK